MHAIGKAVSSRTKFAKTVRTINPTVTKSLKGHCRAAFIRKFAIIWRKSLPGLNLAHPRPDGLSFTALRACVPAAFASGGRSHSVWYLSGSFDILRQFAFEKLARREPVSGYRSHGVRTHRRGGCVGPAFCRWADSSQNTGCESGRVRSAGSVTSQVSLCSHTSYTHTPSLRNVYLQIH